jgi:hypothetical protein
MYREESANLERFWKLVAEKASPAAKDNLQTWISQNGFSSHMRVVARKSSEKSL